MSLEMSEEEYLKSHSEAFKRIGKGLQAQIISYTIIALVFFLSVYNDQIIYIGSMLGILLLSLFLFFRNQKKVLNFFLVIGSLYLLFLPFNIFYEVLTNGILKDPVGLKVKWDLQAFFALYGYLSLFAIISEAIIALVIYLMWKRSLEQAEGKQYKELEVGSEPEIEYGIWEYFLIDTNWKKILMLFCLLTVSAVFEEIVFRYFLLNIFLLTEWNIILIIIICSLIFGAAHYLNGGWIFCVNSTFAGIFFCIAFLHYGLLFSWLLHIVWNALIVFQMFVNTKLMPNYLSQRALKAQNWDTGQ